MSIQQSSSKADIEAAIVCRSICKAYGEGEERVEALRGVDLVVNQGELKLIMGPSGSGKTTLISVISGILSQDSGECWVKGVELTRLSDSEKTLFRCQNIGFVFQAFNLIPMLTIEENISIPLLLGGLPRMDALKRAKEVLEEVGLEQKIGKFPAEISGGQQQRIAIARAIVHDPHFIVCDEPTSFLDHETGMKVMELLLQLVRKNKVTLVVVTHDPRIVHFADSIDRLEDGIIVERSGRGVEQK
jgi:putative ABC transport system ATP-binding protein